MQGDLELNGGVDFGEQRGVQGVALNAIGVGGLEFELNGGVDFGERRGCMRVTLNSTVALAWTFEFLWNKQNNGLH